MKKKTNRIEKNKNSLKNFFEYYVHFQHKNRTFKNVSIY